MFFETITISSAGSITVAVLCLLFALFQGLVAYKRPEFAWNRWGAVLSFLTALYALAVFFQYNLHEGPWTQLCEKVQFSVFVLLLYALYHFSFAYLALESRWCFRILSPLTVICLALIWFTDLIIAPTFVARSFLWNPRPYIEPDLGPLGIAYLGLVLIQALVVLFIWWPHARRKMAGARALVACFFVWFLLGLHDILGTLGMPTVQFLMEYGFLGFSFAMISITIRKYVALFQIVEDNEQALQNAKERLEQRVEKRTVAIARSNRELKTEIRDRKRVEKTLRESEEKFRALITNISDVIMILGADGTILYKSPNVTRYFGWDPGELVGRDGLEHVHPDDGPRVKAALKGLMQKPGGSRTLEFRYRHKNRTYRFIELIAVNMLDNPRIKGIMGNYRDITDRMASERAGRKNEQRLEKAQAIAHVGYWEFDPASKTIRGSGEWLRIYGFDPSSGEIALDQVRSIMVAADRSRAIKALNNLIYKNEEYDFMFRIRRAGDGRLVWLHSRAELIQRTGDRPPIVSGMIQDITSFKQAEEEKAQLENQLRHAQKMESIGTLAGGIAHDFNNILWPIIGFAEMTAADLEENSPLRSNLNEILKAANRAKEMVQQILTFSRRNKDEQKPLKEKPIIEESLKLLRSSLPATIEIQSRLNAESEFVMADATQIHQLVLNLCTNAYQAMRDRGGVLEVSLEEVFFDGDVAERPHELSPGAHACLKIRDTGPGMDAATMERIFEPYFTTKGPAEGTGMGLSMVHGIVQSYNGCIDVESTVGIGTLFTIYIPQIASGEETSITETTDFIPVGHERLLLVDDEPQLLEMQRQMLKRLGYEVTAVSGSVEALDLFGRNPEAFDLMITDQTMPNLTGGELAARILHIRDNLPIILCTGFSESLSPEAAAEIGIRHYLHKPIPLKALARTVRLVLNDAYESPSPGLTRHQPLTPGP
ncbi:MAG: PAS domain S-box protein [Desulfosarcina sp.]|nr:PAS domain S-box protein [Desulfobacterales bacterium]